MAASALYMGERSKPDRIISWVFSLVCVSQQGSCWGGFCTRGIKEKEGIGSLSPSCSCNLEKSIVLPSIRGGVPVFKRPRGSFNSFNLCAKVKDAGSPALPPE